MVVVEWGGYTIEPGADLSGVTFPPDEGIYGAYLPEANLSRANLSGSHLFNAYLTDANLTDANLTDANLAEAYLFGADLTGADLTRANLVRALADSDTRWPNGFDPVSAGVHTLVPQENLAGANLSYFDHLPDLNLTDANLTGANLVGVYFNAGGIVLTRANLSGADLSGAHLTGADLTGAHLTGADLTGADLTGANLTGANLTGAELSRALADSDTSWPEGFDPVAAEVRMLTPGGKCYGAHLVIVDLTGADLRGVDLTGANLRSANLTGANLTGANLIRANLIRANLTDANLENAVLAGADLEKANLTRANLENVDLAGANLSGANIYAARFSGAWFNGTIGLHETHFDGAQFDMVKFGGKEMGWPKGLDVGVERRQNSDWIQALTDLQIDEVYYLAPLANLDSILTKGILSHGEIERRGLQHLDISFQSVQRRRSDLDLHDRVPFYFAPRTPMSSVLRDRNGELCLLVVDVTKLCRGAKEISFTDGNGASGNTRRYVQADELADHLPLDAIRATYWTDQAIADGRRRRSAELLVVPEVSATAIKHIEVPSPAAMPAVVSAIECAWPSHPGDRRPRCFVKQESFFVKPGSRFDEPF